MFSAAVTLFFILLLPNLALARWEGPKVMVTGTWGNSIGQFYFYHGESADYFPKEFTVDNEGNILIADEDNKRILIYDKNGRLKKLLTKPSQLSVLDDIHGWPGSLVSYEGGNSVVIPCRYEKIPSGRKPLKQCFIDYDGRIMAEVPLGYVVPVEKGYILRTKDRSYLYSPTGKMIEERPAVKINRSYLEDEYGGFLEYKASSNSNKCEEKLGSLKLPYGYENDDYTVEYGDRVISSNCDVYIWKRTPDAYSILKWIWVNDKRSTVPPSGAGAVAK